MWKNIVERGRLQITTWCMRITCWIMKATNTHSEYVILSVFRLQHWLQERAAMLRYIFIACLVLYVCMWYAVSRSRGSVSAGCRGKHLGVRGRNCQEAGRKCMQWRFMICTLSMVEAAYLVSSYIDT